MKNNILRASIAVSLHMSSFNGERELLRRFDGINLKGKGFYQSAEFCRLLEKIKAHDSETLDSDSCTYFPLEVPVTDAELMSVYDGIMNEHRSEIIKSRTEMCLKWGDFILFEHHGQRSVYYFSKVR